LTAYAVFLYGFFAFFDDGDFRLVGIFIVANGRRRP